MRYVMTHPVLWENSILLCDLLLCRVVLILQWISFYSWNIWGFVLLYFVLQQTGKNQCYGFWADRTFWTLWRVKWYDSMQITVDWDKIDCLWMFCAVCYLNIVNSSILFFMAESSPRRYYARFVLSQWWQAASFLLSDFLVGLFQESVCQCISKM